MMGLGRVSLMKIRRVKLDPSVSRPAWGAVTQAAL